MSVEAIPYILLLLGSILIASIAQVLLKVESQKDHPTLLSQYLNPLVVVSYALMLITTVMCVFGYKMVPLGLGVGMDALSYVFATIWGRLFFGEAITTRKLFGLALIVCGIILIGLQTG